MRCHHGFELAQNGADVGADVQDADGAVAFTNGLINRHVLAAKKAGPADIGFALIHQGIGRVVAVQQRLEGTLTILLFDRGRHADEVIPRAREDGGRGTPAYFEKLVHHIEVTVERRPLIRQHGLGLAICPGHLGHFKLAREIGFENGEIMVGLVLRGLVKGLHQRAHLGGISAHLFGRHAAKIFPEQAADDAHGDQQDHQQADQRSQ